VITAVTLPCVSDLSPDNTGAIGKAVTKLRMERGWTLRELAEKMGSTNPTMSRKESGQISIKPPERRKFAQVFGLTLDQFDAEWRASTIPQSKVSVGIPVINRAPAGGVVDMEECGTDSGQGFEYLDRDADTQADLLFGVIITGHSMEPALFNGDYAIFHPLDRYPRVYVLRNANQFLRSVVQSLFQIAVQHQGERFFADDIGDVLIREMLPAIEQPVLHARCRNRCVIHRRDCRRAGRERAAGVKIANANEVLKFGVPLCHLVSSAPAAPPGSSTPAPSHDRRPRRVVACIEACPELFPSLIESVLLVVR